MFFFFLKEEYTTVCVGWESAVHHLVIHANKHKQSSPAVTNRRNTLPEMLIVPPLSLNPLVLIWLPPPPPLFLKPVEMTCFYPSLFTLSFNLVMLQPDQCSLEIDVILLAHFQTCVGSCGCACVSSCVLISWTGIKTNQFETPCSLLFLHLLSVPLFTCLLFPRECASHTEKHSRTLPGLCICW